MDTHNNPKKILKSLKYLFFFLVFLIITIILWDALNETSHYFRLLSMSNHNYIPEIKRLKDEGKLTEALQLTKYVRNHPDLPGQKEAEKLEKELEAELNSWLGKTKRFISGFFFGSGNSIEETAGGITSDMIIWGDLRDLIKQGYYKVTGKETDEVIIALASIGLLTEAVDIVDWAPAVLKALRKVGALSKKFADFIITTAKKSAKLGKLDDSLKTTLKNISGLAEKIGLARSATVMKHVDTAEDLASITKIAEKNADTAYLIVKNGGKDGVNIIKRFENSDEALRLMNEAVKKGPAGIQYLKQITATPRRITKITARVLKNLRLGRIQTFLNELLMNFPDIRKFFWIATIVFFGLTLLCFYLFITNLLSIFGKPKSSVSPQPTTG